jgi:hypothetical protein
LSNLPIAEALNEAQGENLRRPWFQSGDGARQGLSEAAVIGLQHVGSFFRQGHGCSGLTRSNYVEGSVDCRSAQITLGVLHRTSIDRAGIDVPPQKAQKDGLQYVFRVRGVSRHPVSRSEDKPVLSPKGLLEFVGDRDYWFL